MRKPNNLQEDSLPIFPEDYVVEEYDPLAIEARFWDELETARHLSMIFEEYDTL